MMGLAGVVFAAGLWASSASAAVLQVYSNDFDGSETFGGGASGGLSDVTSTEGVQSYSGLGSAGDQFGGNMLRNSSVSPISPTTLTLNGLPSHDSIDIDFLLAIIDSWDSTNGSPAPDFFNVQLDGVSLLQHTYANASGSVTDATGTDIGSGCQGRGFAGFCDRAFDAGDFAGLSVAHSSSTATISLFASGGGWQGGGDESWGIDNLRVFVNTVENGGGGNGVPEPMTLGLIGAGLAGFALLRRRRG
jgi:hypothetical protein